MMHPGLADRIPTRKTEDFSRCVSLSARISAIYNRQSSINNAEGPRQGEWL